MNCIKVNTEKGKVIMNLPTNVEDIKVEYLLDVTKHIKVAPEYSLVALVYKTTLAEALNVKNKNGNLASVIPLFVKCGNTDNEFINSISTKDIVVITGSNLSLGIHIGNPFNELSLSTVISIVSKDADIVRNSFSDKNIYHFVEFKLIPNCNINGVLKHRTFAPAFYTIDSDKEA